MFGYLFSKTDSMSVGLYGRIIATDPIVTISKRTPGTPLGIAGVAPEFFRGENALHILSNTWHHRNEKKIRLLRRQLRRLSRRLVNNHFLYLGNTAYEVQLLSKYGIPVKLSSELISIDDSIFRPGAEPLVKLPPADAVYIARMKEFKRHDLAYGLDNVALIYGRENNNLLEQLRREKPHWIFVNHELGSGDYYRLNAREIAGILNQCRVGLCLSAEEGAMRASMEYLMSGLPVVSTRNVGGRDRYLDPDNSLHVDNTPRAVAAAVQSFLDHPPDRKSIREGVMHKVNLDRQDFIHSVNEDIEHLYGVTNHLESCQNIIGYIEGYRKAGEILTDLEDL